ncbi:hypothetical protein C0J52_04372 [Blattella germanica]|nr:hypothetical protein C0J52_04372 [Blattella germanica]
MARAKGFKETLQAAKEKARAKAVPAKRKCFGDNEGKGKSEKKLKDVEECYCELCNEDRIEGMIRCMKCKLWIHAKCAGVGKGVCNGCK